MVNEDIDSLLDSDYEDEASNIQEFLMKDVSDDDVNEEDNIPEKTKAIEDEQQLIQSHLLLDQELSDDDEDDEINDSDNERNNSNMVDDADEALIQLNLLADQDMSDDD